MAPIEQDPQAGLNGAVAAELRGERAAQQVTIAALAEAADIPEVSLQRYLAGKRHIDVSVLATLAHALGTNPDAVVAAAMARLEREGTPMAADRSEDPEDRD